jgi:hypothetical protein
MAAPYATAEDLAAAVRVQVTVKNQDKLDSCVAAASEEIDHGHVIPDPTPALAHEVCIARGVEWWKANDAAFGAVGGFARHEAALIPYQVTFGIA